ncbi:trehalose transporter 1-like protein [Leptinotarsa decemlineata]|uniref:trehalose transporter 1-like protein n=1 Tax=Leptinotarsa decemlineata TaxID=7539 RepID=UPI003D305D33
MSRTILIEFLYFLYFGRWSLTKRKFVLVIDVVNKKIMSYHQGDKLVEEVVYTPIEDVDGTVQFKPKDSRKKNDTLFLYFVVITASVQIFVKGCNNVWPSPVIPQLKSNNSDINPLEDPITTAQISMLFGIPSAFRILGALFLGKLPDIIGRKKTLLVISLLTLPPHLVMVLFGSQIYVYIIGRSIVEIGFGFTLSGLPIYLNEICEDHNRAKHGCLMMFFLPLGSVYGYLVGPLTSVRWFTFLCAAPLIPQIILSLVLFPESPIYSAAKGDRVTAINTLKKLRSNKTEDEIVQDYIEIERSLTNLNEGVGCGFKELFSTRGLRMTTSIGFLATLSVSVSGVPIIMAYVAPLFNDANTNLSGNSVAILVGVVELTFYFVTFAVVKKVGSRPLLLFSYLATGVFLTIIAVYFYLNATNSPIVHTIRWSPIVCVLLYVSSYSLGIGIGSVTVSLLSELYPNDMRSTGCCFVRTTVDIISAIISAAFPLVVEYLGVHYCVGMFSICCFLILVFMYFFLPETRGRSFLEIQKILSK